MKDRKIIIAALLTSLLLSGCGARNESEGFIDVEKKTTVTTTQMVPFIETKATDNEVEEDDEQYDWDYDSEKEEVVTSKQTFKDPDTIIPDSNIVVTTTTSQRTTQAAVTTTNQSAATTTTETLYEEPMPTETNTQTTTETTSVITKVTPQPVNGIQEVPDRIMNIINYWKGVYPGMQIGYGLYSLDGKSGFEYNAHTLFNSACTIKAPYSYYVLKTCEEKGIDLYSDTIEYQAWQKDDGTSVISDYGTVGTYYSLDELMRYLDGESDNTAYTMLTTKFPVSGMYNLIVPLGGQSDWQKWGSASVTQRKNEWLAMYEYMNSGSYYGDMLRQYLSGTKYCYLVQCMQMFHGYIHKSGWTDDEPLYPAANDCAIIDDQFLLIVMTQDYQNYKVGHYDVVQALGVVTETYINQDCGGKIF